MKKIVLLVSTLLIGSACLAADNTDKSKIDTLGAAFKARETTILQQHQDRIIMVYGGADVSRRPTLAVHTLVG